VKNEAMVALKDSRANAIMVKACASSLPLTLASSEVKHFRTALCYTQTTYVVSISHTA